MSELSDHLFEIMLKEETEPTSDEELRVRQADRLADFILTNYITLEYAALSSKTARFQEIRYVSNALNKEIGSVGLRAVIHAHLAKRMNEVKRQHLRTRDINT